MKIGIDLGGGHIAVGVVDSKGRIVEKLEKRLKSVEKKQIKKSIENYIVEDKPIKTSMIRKALENNDELVKQIIDEASEYLASGIAGINNFYNPSLIILGGGLMNAIEYFYKKTIETAKIKSLPTPAMKIRFKKAQLGDFSGITGAALLNKYRTKADI